MSDSEVNWDSKVTWKSREAWCCPLCTLLIFTGICFLSFDPSKAAVISTAVFGSCCFCCGCCLILNKLDEEEIFDNFLGEWNIAADTDVAQTTFTKANVTRDTIHYTGPNGMSEVVELFLCRRADGLIDLDKAGNTIIKKWDEDWQELNVVGFWGDSARSAVNSTWRRPIAGIELIPTTASAPPEETALAPRGETNSALQPGFTGNLLPAIGMLDLPEWWETSMDPEGRVFYKNKYKNTSSWTPPTPEQIALETQERRTLQEDFDLPPPAYIPDNFDPPSAY